MNHEQSQHTASRGRFTQLSRREFVKTTAATALLSAPFVHAAGSDTIRVGLVGCGGRGTGAAFQALKADQEVVLTAMGDMFEEKLSASLQRLTKQDPQRVRVPPEGQFVGFDAYRNVIDSDVDVVILATPPHFRPAHLKAAVHRRRLLLAVQLSGAGDVCPDPGGRRRRRRQRPHRVPRGPAAAVPAAGRVVGHGVAASQLVAL
jgi:hypothetical protein